MLAPPLPSFPSFPRAGVTGFSKALGQPERTGHRGHAVRSGPSLGPNRALTGALPSQGAGRLWPRALHFPRVGDE